MSTPDATQNDDTARKILGALRRYQVMAFIAGVWLIMLSVEMVMKYLVQGGESFLGAWVARVHGWVYVIYVIAVVDLWTRARVSTGHLISMVLAGVVPIFSFIQERRTSKVVRSILSDQHNR